MSDIETVVHHIAPRTPIQEGHHNLRIVRQKLGITLRDIEQASAKIAAKHNNDEYLIPISRLSDFENKGVTPSIYRLYSLAVIFRCDLGELLSWYGVELDNSPHEPVNVRTVRSTSHFVRKPTFGKQTEMHAILDRAKTRLGSMFEQWGAVPFAYLEHLSNGHFTYGYVGNEDYTMYPILPPGTFVQVDESLNRVQKRVWKSEYKRPIYFVETRHEYVCCWCSMEPEQIILESHPLSPVPTRTLAITEAEVIGQVVGVAMRFGNSARCG